MGHLPSVTTILSVISKPALYLWHAKQGTLKALNVMERLKEMAPFVHDALKKEFGDAFFKDGNVQATEAADYGKMAHAIIEAMLKGMGRQSAPEPVEKAVDAFVRWREREDFKLIRAESVVYSKKFKYAGTCDAIGHTKNGVTLLDWKTSKYIYPEYHLQTVAYKYAAEEMSNERIQNVMICRFGKDGSFESYTVPNTDHADLFDRFIDAKRLWEWQRKTTV